MRSFHEQAKKDAEEGLQCGKDRLRIVEALIFVRNNPDQLVEDFVFEFLVDECIWIDATDEAVMQLDKKYPVYWDRVKNKFWCVPFFKDDKFLFSIGTTSKL